MGLLHLAALLVSATGVALVDARWRLFLWARPARAAVVVAAGTAFLLAWDVAGIAGGIFLRAPNEFSTGILLAPHLPIEEPVFLAFLCQLTMTCYAGVLRLGTRRTTRSTGGPARDGGAPS